MRAGCGGGSGSKRDRQMDSPGFDVKLKLPNPTKYRDYGRADEFELMDILCRCLCSVWEYHIKIIFGMPTITHANEEIRMNE